MNSQAFTPEEVELGLHLDLVKCLLNISSKMTDLFIDIHITNDGCCTIIEWCNVYYDNCSGKFEYVGEEQVVMFDKRFPDEHYELCYSEDDYQEKLKNFLKKNPEWEQTEYGTWTNKIENKKMKKEFGK